MTEDVVVLGSGYAGAGAIRSLEAELGDEADVTWVSDVDYHLVLHESHRCIRDPEVAEHVKIPIEDVKSRGTRFVQGEVVDIDTGDRAVALADGSTVAYDYLLVCLGSRTAFFGIDGLEEHALTLKGLDDALAIHDAVADAAREATRTDPGRVVVGGAGLSGIQSAAEIAEFRDERRAPLEIVLVEGLDRIFPGNDPELQGALRKRLEARDVEIMTGEFVDAVDEGAVHVGDEELAYDVLLWTGGITGRNCVRETGLRTDERNHRINAAATFRTGDDRVFAIGDCALVDQPDGIPAPPTAQAAWQAAEVAGVNVARALRGQPLEPWTYRDKGTLISVGDDAVAHGIDFSPISTFGGPVARFLKKAIAVRWIATVDGPVRALRAWPHM